MLSKLSVKKPMTIFVAVILVIVFGIVSFTRMTPDLMPNMDLPYAMIMTPYIGQTPETVEANVTKPLEQTLSTIDGVKQITSNSADSYSILIIEFEDGTNMDSVTVDIRSGLDTITDAWDDAIGTPYLIKANPNLLPVAMTAVNYEGKDRAEISAFVSDELMNRIEGIDGVASVTDKGIVEEKENVVISQKKLDALNKKINSALDSQFADAEDKLNEAKQQIEDNAAQAESGAQTITDSIGEINARQEALASQLADAQAQANGGKTKLISAKMELLDQKSALTQTKQVLELSYQALLSIQTTYNELLQNKAELVEHLEKLNELSDRYKEILAQLLDPNLDEETIAELKAQLEEIDKVLESYNISKEGLALAITSTEAALKRIDTSLEEINEKLKEFGTDTSQLDAMLKSITNQISQLNSGIQQIDTAISGLDDNSISVDKALATISQQQSSADFKLSGALATLTAKQTEVTAASAQLTAAQTEIQNSLDTLTQQKKAAKEKTNPDNMVTLDTVSGILMAQNFSMPAGYITDDHNNRYLVRVGNEIADEAELTELALFDTKIDGIGVIKLTDVADVFIADNSEEIYARINNQDGVILSFTKQSDIATAAVCENINDELDLLEQEYEGLQFTTLFNQGDYINIVINSVLQNLLLGAVLAIIILLIFLRDIKPTVIVAVSIPISVIFAIVMMYFSGITLNALSLSGLAIGVGMLVDNSIVVIENTYRLRHLGYSAIQAALNGARQMAGAIAASTLTTICVFLPIVFVDGLVRQLFVDLALTITYSLMASLIVALTLVPAMSQSMLRKIRQPKKTGEGKILKTYDKSVRFVLRHKIVSILVVIGLLFGSAFLTFVRGFSFMAEMSSTEVQVSITLDPNATFEETVAVANQVNDVLLQYDEFETVGVTVGSSMGLMGLSAGGAQSDAGSVMAYGVLKEDKAKSGAELSKIIQKELDSIDGEVTVSGGSSGSMSTLLGDGSVQVKLFGDDLKTLQATAEDMAQRLSELEGIEETDSGVGATSPEISIKVDKLKAAQKGLTTAQVFQQVAAAVSNEKSSTTLKTENGSLDVVIVRDDSKHVSPNTIGSIDIIYTDAEGNNKNTSLSSVAEIEKSETMNTISRQNQKRYLVISGTVKEGYTLTNVSNRAKAMLDSYKLPAGFSISYDGTDKATMEAIQQLMLMMLLGVIMIYLIMVAQFQSLKSPFIIMFTIPLAFTGGFLALLLTGLDISVISLIGFIMLCGIIVNNGIVLVDYINILRLEGKERVEAIVEAGKTRMRPIFITAMTTVLGLSVMALGIGTGAEMMQPIAIVCIGGLIYATMMTLYVVPLIYDAFNKKELRKVEKNDLETIDD